MDMNQLPALIPTLAQRVAELTKHNELLSSELLHARSALALAAEDEAGTQEMLAELTEQRDELGFALFQLVSDLPSKRDWLDPVVEARARAALKNIKE